MVVDLRLGKVQWLEYELLPHSLARNVTYWAKEDCRRDQ